MPKSNADNNSLQGGSIAPASQNRGKLDAIYMHVPFCFHKCHYCDFYSLVDRPDEHAAFVNRLNRELVEQSQDYQLNIKTIFAGGGTPTLLKPEHWRQILNTLSQTLAAPPAEFTVEANPETVTEDLLATLTAGGVNRLSIGCQSFQPQHLKTLERWHEPANVGRTVRLARAAGLTELNLDLIFAIPGQTLADVDADLDQAMALEPEHISYYNLTYEPNTAMTRRLQLGRISAVDEEVELAMYERILERLDAAGFEQYEVSNWARRGTHPHEDHRCQHNLLYWRNANWLGIGPAAASHVDGRRWKNEPHLGRYVNSTGQPPIVDEEQLPLDARIGEQFMLGLRLNEGLPMAWVNANAPAGHRRGEEIDSLIQMGFLVVDDARLKLTRRGLCVADGVVARLL